MAKPTAYLETTVIGHLIGRMHPEPIIAGRQAVTREWWKTATTDYQLLVSQLVADECGSGDADAAAERLAALDGLKYIEASDKAYALAEQLITAMAIPATEPRDALHISIAAVNGVEFLVTWNFKHIANVNTRDLIELTCRQSGFNPPTICTPDELLGG